MRDYTPTAASIRSDYIRGAAADFIATEGKRCPCGSAHPVKSETARVALVWDREARAAAGPEFDRWLAEEIRKAKAEAWESCAAVVEDIIIDLTGDIEPHERMLANPYREEEHSE